MDAPEQPYILYSPAPHGHLVLLCPCGNSEVSKQQASWERFTPDFTRQACLCGECRTHFPLRINDDSHLHFKKT